MEMILTSCTVVVLDGRMKEQCQKFEVSLLEVSLENFCSGHSIKTLTDAFF